MTDGRGTTTTYAYDLVGNRLSRIKGTEPIEEYDYNYLNQLTHVQQGTAVTTYTYDARGNQTKQVQTGTGVTTTTNYGYDLANRLISLDVSNNAVVPTSTSATFAYNAQGQRITRVENEVVTHFYYTGSALLFTTVNEYVLQTQNILDPSGALIASKRFEGQAEAGQDPYADDYFFYRYDVRGSVTNIVDGAGSVVKSYDYDEFGVTTSTGGGFHNEVTFTGSVADASGLLYMNARYYNPATARFLSQDTYTGSASVPWTQHLYAYCNNNPVNMVDPTGHFPSDLFSDDWDTVPWYKCIFVYGKIHRAVQDEIASKSNNTIIAEKWVVGPGGTLGRVDLLEPATGSIWEVKHHNEKNPERARKLARAQLRRYTLSILRNQSVKVSYSLKIGTTSFSGSFVSKPIKGDTYNISYWTPETGIIEYSFSKNEPEPERARAEAPSGVPIVVPGNEKTTRSSESPVGIAGGGFVPGIVPYVAPGGSGGFGFGMGGRSMIVNKNYFY